MERFRWIREGDRAACDGMVIEGDQSCISHGRAYAFEGARLICQRKCVITEGTARRTLANGRRAVLHGMKTSGGCPLLSSEDEHAEASASPSAPITTAHPEHEPGCGHTIVWLAPRVDYGPAGMPLNQVTEEPATENSAPRHPMRQKRRLSSILLLAIGAVCSLALYRHILA